MMKKKLFFFGRGGEGGEHGAKFLCLFFCALGWLILKYSGIVCVVTMATVWNVAHINCCR